jgi:PucR family transcriptional regulator, purine catabolism regulatory protein
MGHLTVRDLIETAQFGLETLAGAAGLDRTVEWVHISADVHPAMWLDGGELLLTNGRNIPPDPDSQVSFLHDLTTRGAVGLAVGQSGPVLRPELLEAAERCAFPLMRIAYETPYAALVKSVAAANQDQLHRRLATHVRMFDTLGPRANGELSACDLFRRLGDIAGYDFYLVNELGLPALNGLPALPEGLDAYWSTEPRTPPGIPGGFRVAVPVGGRPAAVLYALERTGAEPVGLTAVRHVITIAALELAVLDGERQARRREGAELLAELLNGGIEPGDARRRMRQIGLAQPSELLLVAADGTGTEGLDDSRVHRLLSDSGTPHALLRQDVLLILLSRASAGVLDTIAGRTGAVAGVSNPFTEIAAVPLARKEALWAYYRHQGGAAVAYFAQTATDLAHWLPGDLASLRRLVDTTLGPVIEYDAAHDTELLRSLRVFYRHDRRLAQAAEELFIHKHTLAYRLKRVSELTGRDLGSVQVMAEISLALQALKIVGHH